MYAHAVEEQSVKNVWSTTRKKLVRQIYSLDSSWREENSTFNEIDSIMEKFGDEFKTKAISQLEEECEREIEAEIEEEEELQIELPSRKPRPEQSWDLQYLLSCSSAMGLNTAIGVRPFADFVSNFIHFEVQAIGEKTFTWPSNLFGTENFFFTTCELGVSKKEYCNDFLRLVDCMLVFSNGDVLLLSEQEADEVLELTWRFNNVNFVLVNFTYARSRNREEPIKLQSPTQRPHDPLQLGSQFSVSNEILAALSLFQGLTMFQNDNLKKAVEEIVSGPTAKKIAPTFCQMRDLSSTYDRSDLENICGTLADTNEE